MIIISTKHEKNYLILIEKNIAKRQKCFVLVTASGNKKFSNSRETKDSLNGRKS